MKLKGYTIFVDEVGRTVNFYKGIFSAEPTHREENSASYMINGIRFFIHKKQVWEEGMPPNEDHIEFEVDDLESEVERLKNQGFKVEIEPKKYYWGYSAYLRDSEGRMIEFVQK